MTQHIAGALSLVGSSIGSTHPFYQRIHHPKIHHHTLPTAGLERACLVIERTERLHTVAKGACRRADCNGILAITVVIEPGLRKKNSACPVQQTRKRAHILKVLSYGKANILEQCPAVNLVPYIGVHITP